MLRFLLFFQGFCITSNEILIFFMFSIAFWKTPNVTFLFEHIEKAFCAMGAGHVEVAGDFTNCRGITLLMGKISEKGKDRLLLAC